MTIFTCRLYPLPEMARSCALVIILFTIPLTLLEGDDDPTPSSIIGMDRFSQDLIFFESLSPRAEGTEQERVAIDYIISRAEELNLKVKEDRYDEDTESGFENWHSFSSLLEVSRPGPTGGTLTLVVALNAGLEHSDRKRDGSVNLALALYLLSSLPKNDRQATLRILFLGAEKGPSPPYPIGSQYFLRKAPLPANIALIYLHFSVLPKKIELLISTHGEIAPYWLVKDLSRIFSSQGLPQRIGNLEPYLYRFGLPRKKSNRVSPFLKQDYPALTLGGEGHALNDEETLKKIAQSFSLFLESFPDGFPEEWDRHYLSWNLPGGKVALVPSSHHLVVLVAICMLILTMVQHYARPIRLNMRLFRRHFWTYPLLLILVFLSSMLGTFVTQAVLVMRDFPTLWEELPTAFFLLKFSATSLSFSLLVHFLPYFRFSRSPHFYSYTSVLSTMLMFLLSLFYNVTLSFYFCLNLALACLFTLSKSYIVKFIYTIITGSLFVAVMTMLLMGPIFDVAQTLLTPSQWRSNILGTLMIAPHLLMSIGLYFYHHHYTKKHKIRRYVLLMASLSVIFAGAFFYTLFSPVYGKNNPQLAIVTETIRLDKKERFIGITSAAPIGDALLRVGELVIPLHDAKKNTEIQLDVRTPYLKVGTEESFFLDRREVRLRVEAKGTPALLQIELTSLRAITIYDCNFPYEIVPSGEKARIHVGRNPHLPLEVSLTLTKQTAPLIQVSLFYEDYPYDFDLERENLVVRKSLRITTTHRLQRHFRLSPVVPSSS